MGDITIRPKTVADECLIHTLLTRMGYKYVELPKKSNTIEYVSIP